MSQNNQVTCPNCKHQFSIESALTADIEKEIADKLKKEFNEKWVSEKRKADEQIKLQKEQIETERKKQVEEQAMELANRKKEVEEQVKLKLNKENELQIEFYKKQNEENEEKLKTLRKLEVEKMEIQQRMKDLENQHELDTKKLLLEKENELKERIGKEADQKNEMRLKEFQKKIDDQNKLIEEMKRKSEQGSMQMQGEVQELALEEMLKQIFPFDDISEVGKGVKGADLIQTVKNGLGQPCGTIIWESKRTKDFQPLWIEKFKADFRQSGGDVGVIVTQAMPKDMEGFGIKEGVYICQFHEARSLALILRQTLIKISEANASQENKGEKMTMLYHYLTGNEFKHQIEAISEGFMSLKTEITREKIAMERLWKEREKQIEKVLINTVGMYGSIKGIAGNAIAEIKGLEIGGNMDPLSE
ncbi:MAG: DUF2130 domain-containing protein [bacterium]|nr:DUF2130 domain-containing protein [bacterium]